MGWKGVLKYAGLKCEIMSLEQCGNVGIFV